MKFSRRRHNGLTPAITFPSQASFRASVDRRIDTATELLTPLLDEWHQRLLALNGQNVARSRSREKSDEM
jgi:hypothetical protein